MLMKNTELNADEFINLLTDKEITVYEDVQGTKIWCNYDNGWNIRPKSLNQKPINIVDLTYQKIYKYAYGYLLSLDKEVTDLLKPNIFLCFEYFPDTKPANIKYDGLPKNRLILTCVNRNRKYIYDYKLLKTYSDLLNVETLPIIYNGILSNKQLTDISTYLSMGSDDIDFLNGEPNFSKFFYNLLNPNTEHSYLKGDFQDNLEKIIIRFGNDKEITLELLNPLYKRNEFKIDSNYSDIFSILTFNFLDFIYEIDIDDIELKGRTREIIYINLICNLYNKYMDEYEKDINELDFVIPDFFQEDKFRINDALISNDKTKKYLNRSIKNQYLLKILLSTFRGKKNKPIGIFTDLTLKYLNNMIRKLHIKIEEIFNYNHSFTSYAIKKDLTEYSNIVWEEDHRGFVKTKKTKLFDKGGGNKKKYKK